MAAENYEAAISLIDEAHAQDPNIVIVDDKEVPYELHYARRMTQWLELRCPDAGPILKTAIRAQHFRRWEIPRSSYPAGRTGYLTWRTFLKKRQASLASAICIGCNFTDEEAAEVARLIRKEDLKNNEETKVLEDVACLVFLAEEFEGFEKGLVEGKGAEEGEEKVVAILRKTWGKMSEKGRELALAMDLSERSKSLIGRALAA